MDGWNTVNFNVVTLKVIKPAAIKSGRKDFRFQLLILVGIIESLSVFELNTIGFIITRSKVKVTEAKK